MNLQEIIDYRNTCVICQKTMQYKMLDIKPKAATKQYVTTVVPEGLRVQFGPKKVSVFKLDGTYNKASRWNIKRPLILDKECPDCNQCIRFKQRALGATTLMDINRLCCSYRFEIFGDAEGNYAINHVEETVKYHNREEFYHINTDYRYKQSQLFHGNYKRDTIDKISKLYIPPVNLVAIKNIDQFINKFKMYTLFS